MSSETIVELNPKLVYCRSIDGKSLIRPAQQSYYHQPELDKYQQKLESEAGAWFFQTNYSEEDQESKDGATVQEDQEVNTECIKLTMANNFIRTYWECFHSHGTAVFSPSDIWLVISLSFSKYAAEHPETMKHFINTNSSDKKILTVQGILQNDPDSWSRSISQMVEGVRKASFSPDLVSNLQNDLSCALPVEKLACNVAILKATEKSYIYHFMALCGFKSVKILGELEDWEHLRDKILKLRDMDFDSVTRKLGPQKQKEGYLTIYDKPTNSSQGDPLVPSSKKIKDNGPLMQWSHYTNNLLEIVEKFIGALKDNEKADKQFFREIVHNETALGFYEDKADEISGWILKLFYGFKESYIVSSVPILEANICAWYQPNSSVPVLDNRLLDSAIPITIRSGFWGHKIYHNPTHSTHEYRPITFCSVLPGTEDTESREDIEISDKLSPEILKEENVKNVDNLENNESIPTAGSGKTEKIIEQTSWWHYFNPTKIFNLF